MATLLSNALSVGLNLNFAQMNFKVMKNRLGANYIVHTVGLSKETNNFYTSEVMEKAKAIATNYMIESLNKTFKTMRHSVNSSNGIIKMSYRPLKKVCVKELEDKDTVESIFECSCCNRHIKVLYCAGASKIFCSYCGVDL